MYMSLLQICYPYHPSPTLYLPPESQMKSYEENQLSMVSKTAVPPGTCLIVRMLDLPGIKHCRDVGAPRTVGIAEVQDVEEVMDDGGMAYKLLAKYLYTE